MNRIKPSKKLVGPVIGAVILVLWFVCLCFGFTNTYDTATPAGTDDPREADDRMRETKAAVQERLDVAHHFALTGTEVSDSKTGYHKFWCNVVAYGADATGATDSTAAAQAAVDASEAAGHGHVYLPEGDFRFDGTIYLDSATTNLTYHILGSGKGTWLKPYGFTDKYLFKLNEDSGGDIVLASISSHTRAIFEGFQVSGEDSTSASFLWYNAAPFEFYNINFTTKLVYGAYGTGFTDHIRINYVRASDMADGGYLVRTSGNGGDTFYANQIFLPPPTDYSQVGFHITKVAAGQMNAVNGGTHVIATNFNFEVSNCHFEQGHDNPLTITSSKVSVTDCWFQNHNDLQGYPIIIDDDGSGTGSNVSLENCVFAILHDSDGDRYKEYDDIRINNPDNDTKVILNNNIGTFNIVGQVPVHNLGITMSSGDTTLNTELAAMKGQLSGSCKISRLNGTWEVTPINGGPFTVNSISLPTLSITISTVAVGEIADTTAYYYRIATYSLLGNTEKSSEKNPTATADDQAFALSIDAKADIGFVRVWRGTSANTYTRYVDIPLSASKTILYDTGSYIAGYVWLTSPPTAPTVNTAFEGFKGSTTFIGRERMLGSATVDLQNGDSKSTVLTFPTGKKAIITKVVIHSPTASLAGGTDFDIGSTANANTWLQAVNLSSMTATTDYMVLVSSATKYTLEAAAAEFGIKPITGATADAQATMEVFGYLK